MSITDQLIFCRELGRMAAVKFGCSVRDVTEDLKVRPGGLLPSRIYPLIRRLPKEETSNVELQRLSCDADILEVTSGRLPESIRDPFTTGWLEQDYPTYEFEYPYHIKGLKSRSHVIIGCSIHKLFAITAEYNVRLLLLL